MNYTFRLEDLEYLAEPVTGALQWDYRPDLPFVDEPCDVELARRYLDARKWVSTLARPKLSALFR